MSGAASGRTSVRHGLLLALAIAWVAGFSAWFYSLGLPNNPPLDRADVWALTPELLLDLAVPGEREDEGSWSNAIERLRWVLPCAGVILGAAWGLGQLVLRALGLRTLMVGVERTVFSFAIGLCGLSLLTLAAGLAGWLSRSVLLAAMGALLLVEIALRVRERGHHDAAAVQFDAAAPSRGFRIACFLLLAPFLAAMLLGAMLPPTDFDARAYHLQGPKEFFQAGRISFLPHNVYTSFPFFTEMLTLLGMVVRGGWYEGAIVGQTVLMAFVPLTALGLYAAGRRWFSSAAGWLAAVIYLSTPWTYRIATIAYAEGGLSFYLLASVLAAGMAIDRLRAGGIEAAAASARRGAGRLYLLAGVMAGSAFACKYPGVVQVVVPIGAACALAPLFGRSGGSEPKRSHKLPACDESPQSQKRSSLPTPGLRQSLIRSVFLYTAGVLIAAGPWLLKNTVQTGNPVYPLLYGVFGGRDWDAQLDRRFRAGHSLGPERFTSKEFVSNVADVAGNNDWHSALVFVFAPLALLWCRGRILGRAALLWAYVAWLFAAWWLLTHRIDRFWVPLLPVACLLAGAGAEWSRSLVWRLFRGTVLLAGILFNLAFVSTPLASNNAWLADSDEARAAAEAFAPLVRQLNQFTDAGQLPPETRILLVGEAQVFDARFPHVYNTVFDRSVFADWFGRRSQTHNRRLELADRSQILNTLKRHGITHVAVNWREVLRYRATYGMTDFVKPQTFERLVEANILQPIAHEMTPVDALPAHLQSELKRWQPRVVRHEDREYVPAWELYRVVSGSPSP
ncbi:MAG: phospholipid carrier-dependent glycosyltransferase [Planctomycetes bacterium]|nr:phospholipid carrier-dependent glycosyltransferase [Planctomycetota bacterium]